MTSKHKYLYVLMMFLISVSMIFSSAVPAGATGSGGTSAVNQSTLRVGWCDEPDSLSPFIAYTQASWEIFTLIYDPLVTLDNNMNPVGVLAKSWSVSPDKLTWTFNLVHGVKWQDGQPFTSEDVKFTYDTIAKSGLGMYSDYLYGIDKIECPDPYTVVIKTKEPKANMLTICVPILPEHIWKNVPASKLDTWPNSDPIGTGPFKFVTWKKGQYIQLAANKDYFGVKPKLDGVIFVLYANDDTMVQSLKLGEIDGAINLNPLQYKSLKTEKNIDAISAAGLGFTELSINSWTDPKSKGNPLLLDKRIRQAIDYAIDKQKIIDVAYAGQGIAGTTLIPPVDSFWHYQPPAGELRTYSVAKANALLDAAGYKNRDANGIREDSKGNKLSFRLFLRGSNAEEVNAGQMIKAMLQQVGIEVNIQTMDDGELSNKIADNANFDMFIWGWGEDVDPTTILSVLTTQQIGNLSDSYYSNAEYDKLFEKQSTLLDPGQRQKVVFEMQKILYQDEPYVILSYDKYLQAVRTDKFQGWTRVPQNGSFFYAINNYNYLHVEPASLAHASQIKSSLEKLAMWIIIIVVIVALWLILRRRARANKD